MNLRKQITESIQLLRKKAPGKWPVGIILGTGLGDFARNIRRPKKVEYGQIPHFPKG